MNDLIEKIKDNKVQALVILAMIFIGGWLYLTSNHSQSTTVTHTEMKASTKQKPVKQNVPSKIITVDVQGAVSRPGVYRLKSGTIVLDAINKAGGPINTADITKVNQAQKLTDSMQVIIPKIGETQSGNANKPVAGDNSKIVNINVAKVEDFKDVKGIGPKKAQKIIDYREKMAIIKRSMIYQKLVGLGKKPLML